MIRKRSIIDLKIENIAYEYIWAIIEDVIKDDLKILLICYELTSRLVYIVHILKSNSSCSHVQDVYQINMYLLYCIHV